MIQGRPARSVADMIRTGQGWSDHRVRDSTAPFTPASCRSPDVTGPSLMTRRKEAGGEPSGDIHGPQLLPWWFGIHLGPQHQELPV